jgi:hypothetical protein
MRKHYRRLLAPLAILGSICGCSHSDDALKDPVNPPVNSPYDNNAPGAKDAPAAPGPGPGVPSPGGGKRAVTQ